MKNKIHKNLKGALRVTTMVVAYIIIGESRHFDGAKKKNKKDGKGLAYDRSSGPPNTENT